ncbi:HTH-type transcriptional regulator BetI [Amylibacter ulvae]|uniref:HTH-type transcriptional regulator BetI n=1 Tax=Paramylibacter ulvae TaxID=1651968 RepID=A0ABQ3D215_9RHOB|nr:transcriptional regulator BetI [Amylibacter ulvae]GHA54610.1 HTH-type transcriptional regulator BetI [Amylibacter ulvae]
MTRKTIRDIRSEELIDAAILAVHERGYGVVTMSEIAARAGTSAASINYYFGSKEQLMEATMRRLLDILKQALLRRLETARTPHERLMAICDANFDDALFTVEQTSVWIQFWSHAPYSPRLSRLHQINRSRVRSHFRAELKRLLPANTRETVRRALQAYMDGVWLEEAQTEAEEPLAPADARRAVRDVAALLLAR